MWDWRRDDGDDSRTDPVPAARTTALISTEVGGDVIIYDSSCHHIHHLNRTAAVVWRLCDGRRSLREIVRRTNQLFDGGVGEDVVRGAIAQLARVHLLETTPAWTAPGGTTGRRRFSRRTAVVAGAAVVVSMTAPTAAAAQSPVCMPACDVCRTCITVNGSGYCAFTCGTSGCSCPSGAYCNGGMCHGSGAGCFVAGTRVAMADGTSRPIELLAPGDLVLGRAGVNRVFASLRPTLGHRPLYALNGGVPFVTSGHPFLTTIGWKAIDPVATHAEVPGLPVGKLTVGDRLLALTGVAVPAGAGPVGSAAPDARVVPVALARVTAHAANPATPLFNLRVDGDHTYIANDLVVHNKFF